MHFSKIQRATMVALIGMGLFNPLTVSVLEDWFKLVYTIVFVGCSLWVCGYLLWSVFKTQPVKLPKTGKVKTKSGLKYELTN